MKASQEDGALRSPAFVIYALTVCEKLPEIIILPKEVLSAKIAEIMEILQNPGNCFLKNTCD